MASTIGTSTASYAMTPSRKLFYASGRFWVFYSDGTNMVYCTSTDDSSWSEPVTIKSADSGEKFSVFYNGTYLYYAYCPGGSGNGLYFRRGTPNSDGSITWSTDEVTVIEGSAGRYRSWPVGVIVDTDGYAWIGYQDDADIASGYYPWAIKATATDGSTWDTPTQLSELDEIWHIVLVPLTSGKVYVIYVEEGAFNVGAPRGKLWNGTSFGDEETGLTEYLIVNYELDWSAIAEEDNVHIAYLRDSVNQVRYNKRTYGVGWAASDTLIRDSAEFDSVPTLSLDSYTGDIYCFYPNVPDLEHIYYRKYTASTNTWETAVDWIDESVDQLAQDTTMSFYQAYGNYIGMGYQTGGLVYPYTYNVRFAFLAVEAPASISSSMAAKMMAAGVL